MNLINKYPDRFFNSLVVSFEDDQKQAHHC